MFATHGARCIPTEHTQYTTGQLPKSVAGRRLAPLHINFFCHLAKKAWSFRLAKKSTYIRFFPWSLFPFFSRLPQSFFKFSHSLTRTHDIKSSGRAFTFTSCQSNLVLVESIILLQSHSHSQNHLLHSYTVTLCLFFPLIEQYL